MKSSSFPHARNYPATLRMSPPADNVHAALNQCLISNELYHFQLDYFLYRYVGGFVSDTYVTLVCNIHPCNAIAFIPTYLCTSKHACLALTWFCLWCKLRLGVIICKTVETRVQIKWEIPHQSPTTKVITKGNNLRSSVYTINIRNCSGLHLRGEFPLETFW